MSRPFIICVDDEQIILDGLKSQLRRNFKDEYNWRMVTSGKDALLLIKGLVKEGEDVPIIISDYIMPKMNGTELFRNIAHEYPDTINILLSGRSDMDAVTAAVNEGNLYRFINKPWDEEDLILTIREGMEKYLLNKKIHEQNKELSELVNKTQEELVKRKKAERELKRYVQQVEILKEKLLEENIYLQEEIQLEHNHKEIIGNSDPLKYVLYRIEQVAKSDSTVLIQGETGTGKELVARAIHQNSDRKDRPLIKVNCAAISSDLIESELFGHEKGAFTGAHERKLGRFEIANHGSILLDEIGEMPVKLQAKILRAIEFQEFERVGNPQPIKVDVRIIASTNRNLEKEIEKGNFRKDLYFRLNVYPISVPPLRQRKGDIPALANAFVNKYAKKMNKNIQSIPQKVLDSLCEYHWPGNIRELENVIERAVILTKSKILHVELPKEKIFSHEDIQPMEEVERCYIKKVLKLTKGKISGHGGAAEILQIHPNTLRSRMDKLGIKK
jgi:formate hydrogenlyase transcriptional activator